MSKTLREAPREVPVVEECDLCVLGGSCTGVFAAVAAARLGLRVAIVEQHGFFGGVATAGLVNIWHSMLSTDGEHVTIAGMTREVIERLAKRNAVDFKDPLVWHGSFILATDVLKIVLDEMVTEVPGAGIRPFLHTKFCAPHAEDGVARAAIIEDKTGRRAIRARYFIDATGDADFVHRCGLPTRKPAHLQPPTACAILRGLADAAKSNPFPEFAKDKFPGLNIHDIIFDKRFPQALREGTAWWAKVPGSTDETLLAGTRVFGADCSDADQLTAAEIEGRRQIARVADLFREHFMGGKGQPLAMCATHIGTRQTRHACCLHSLGDDEVLRGRRFDDAIANGTYPVDIHHTDREGITFRWLDGKELVRDPSGWRDGRWLAEGEAAATYYQVPYRSLVPQGSRNVLVAGRPIDAQEGAFGAVRVMVNCNQMGQAAGVAAALAQRRATDVADVDPVELRGVLKEQGAAVL